MARGVCAMYGIPLPRDRHNAPFAVTPDRMLYSTLLSLRNFLYDYVCHPLQRRWNGTGGKLLSALVLYLLTVLLLRTRPALLLFALPVLLFSLLRSAPPLRRLRTARLPVRLLCSALSALLCAPFTLALLLEDPRDVFALISNAFGDQGGYLPHYVFGIIQDARYLLIVAVILLLLLPVAYFRSLLARKASSRTRWILMIVSTSLCFLVFFLSLIYFMPQFPTFAV